MSEGKGLFFKAEPLGGFANFMSNECVSPVGYLPIERILKGQLSPFIYRSTCGHGGRSLYSSYLGKHHIGWMLPYQLQIGIYLTSCGFYSTLSELSTSGELEFLFTLTPSLTSILGFSCMPVKYLPTRQEKLSPGRYIYDINICRVNCDQLTCI